MGEGFASPNTADSRCVLEAAVGKILRGTEVDTMRRIVAESGTRLDVAGAWAVMQVELTSRRHGMADLDTIAARRRVPPEVLAPVFDRMVAEGLLRGDGWEYEHTEAGRREAEMIRAAFTEWLEQRVEQDIGRPSGTDLRAAVETIAKRLLTEDDLREPARVPAPTG